MTARKGHMHTAGIIPVFLTGNDIWTLHRIAAVEQYTAQEIAEHILRDALDQWANEHPEP